MPWFLMAVILLCCAPLWALDARGLAASWIQEHFRTSYQDLPFSFIYEGRGFHKLRREANWQMDCEEADQDAQRRLRRITYRDQATGLVVRCDATIYKDFPAVEWVLTFHNAGSADTPVVEYIQALNATFRAHGAGVLYYADGSSGMQTDFRPRQAALPAGAVLHLKPTGGRSSDGVLPFFNLALPGHGGVVLGIGWTGQWAARFEGRGDAVSVQAGMERTHLKLHPGEQIRTPAILALFWTGADRMAGQNMLRRFLLRHCMPYQGRTPAVPPFAASPGMTGPFEAISESRMTRYIDLLTEHSLPVDTWWIDTGWYSCSIQNNWARNVGNWDPDPVRFPRGMKPVADAAHAKGLRFLLWFEPERVMPNTWMHAHHPEWLIPPSVHTPPEWRYMLTDRFYLVDLGNPDALAWLKERLISMIREIGIDIYRQDFNMAPLWHWRRLEAMDRQGSREIRYVTGLYDLLDSLIRACPNLLIDNCASGGRRIDFEMMRRSLTLWRSDHCWDNTGSQSMHYGLSFWLPVHGVGAVTPDAYAFHSGMGSHMVIAFDYPNASAEVWEQWRSRAEEYRAVQDRLHGDYYPLTDYSVANDVWMAYQYHSPETARGVVLAFRREANRDGSRLLRLKGLDPVSLYRCTSVEWGNGSRTLSGQELMTTGLSVSLPAPGSIVIAYDRISP